MQGEGIHIWDCLLQNRATCNPVVSYQSNHSHSISHLTRHGSPYPCSDFGLRIRRPATPPTRGSGSPRDLPVLPAAKSFATNSTTGRYMHHSQPQQDQAVSRVTSETLADPPELKGGWILHLSIFDLRLLVLAAWMLRISEMSTCGQLRPSVGWPPRKAAIDPSSLLSPAATGTRTSLI